MALADLVEKGDDADLLRQMIEEVVERVMAFDVENLCFAGYGERSDERDYAGFEIQPSRSTSEHGDLTHGLGRGVTP